MTSVDTRLDEVSEHLVDAHELDPERVRTALALSKWGGRLAATAGAMLPAGLLLVWTYFRTLKGEGEMNPASPIGVVLTMAYFAVLQYMLFLIGGGLLKARYELNRRLDDLQRELYRRVPTPLGAPLLKARYELHQRLQNIEQEILRRMPLPMAQDQGTGSGRSDNDVQGPTLARPKAVRAASPTPQSGGSDSHPLAARLRRVGERRSNA